VCPEFDVSCQITSNVDTNRNLPYLDYESSRGAEEAFVGDETTAHWINVDDNLLGAK
jgi:hypothetical protein